MKRHGPPASFCPGDVLFMFNVFLEGTEHDVKEHFKGLLEKKRTTSRRKRRKPATGDIELRLERKVSAAHEHCRSRGPSH